MKRKWKIYIAIWILAVLLNIVAWNSKEFCDWYIFHIFPLWVNTYGWFTGLFPFSVGEILIVAGVILVIVAFVMGLVYLVLKVVEIAVIRQMKRLEKEYDFAMKYGFFMEKASRVAGSFYQGFVWILAGVALVMTLNCFILYHASSFSEKYFGADEQEYTYEDLVTLRNFVVEKCNELSAQMPRQEDGTIAYQGDMAKVAKQTMQKIGETYEGLK